MRQKKDLGLANKVTRKYKDTNNTEDIAGKLYLDFSDVSNALESFKKYAESRGYNVIVGPYDYFTDRRLKEEKIKIEILKEDTCFVTHIPYCSGKFRNDKNYWTDLRIVIGYPLFTESRKGYPLWWGSAVNYKFKKYLEAKYPEVAKGSYSKEPFDIEALEYIFDFFDKREVNESINLGLASKAKKIYKDEGIDRVYNEFNEESIKDIFNKNICYALYGTTNPNSLESSINMFGYYCDSADGVDNPDLNYLLGCRLYTINHKNLYIYSTILATGDTGEFIGIYIKWCTVDHLGHGEFLLTPDEIENEEIRKEIEEGIVAD